MVEIIISDGFCKVLDKGYVRLIDHMGSDLSVVRAARVSFNADWRAGDDSGSDTRLINYLMKNKHTSPFEAVTFTFEFKVPLFIRSQFQRHRTWAYSEISARYTELPEDFYLPDPQLIGEQSKDNKQARTITPGSYDFREAEVHWLKNHCEEAFVLYHKLLKNGWPRELARTCLPVNTYTRYFGTVNLHNLFHFLSLRDHSHAQYEAQQYAKALIELIEPVVPACVGAWKALRSG